MAGRCTRCLGRHSFKDCRSAKFNVCMYCKDEDPNVELHNYGLCAKPTPSQEPEPEIQNFHDQMRSYDRSPVRASSKNQERSVNCSPSSPRKNHRNDRRSSFLPERNFNSRQGEDQRRDRQELTNSSHQQQRGRYIMKLHMFVQEFIIWCQLHIELCHTTSNKANGQKGFLKLHLAHKFKT